MTDEFTSIPDKRYAPKAGPIPEHRQKRPNFADNEDTVKKALAWAAGYLDHFKAQPARVRAEEKWTIADEMWRIAKTQTKRKLDEPDNTTATKANVSSDVFWTSWRALTAGDRTVILGGEEELPLRYEPIPGVPDYRDDEGWQIAEYQNMLLGHTYVQDDWRATLASIIGSTNKYANSLIGMEWARLEDERTERVVTEWEEGAEDANGATTRYPKKTEFKTKKRLVKDWPHLFRIDLRNAWFDATIDGMQKQSCIIIRGQDQLSDLWQLQEQGEFVNVGDIKKEHFYAGEQLSTVLADRQANAGESGDAEGSMGLCDRFTVWLRAPIDKKGNWAEKKVMPHWHLITWIGDISTGSKPVCVQLTPNPHHCKEVPLELIHAEDDDKGAYHDGLVQRISPFYAQDCTIMNLALDNLRQRGQVPILADKGSIDVNNLLFTAGGNQIIPVNPGGYKDPRELKIADTTGQTLPMLDRIHDRAEIAAGTNAPYLGEPLPSRTAATTAKMTFEQALKPALQGSIYKATQILPFAGKWCAEMWRQFGDPKATYTVTYQGQPREVKSATLWGPYKVRVTSVKNFEDSMLQKQVMNQFLSNLLPHALQEMDRQGRITAFSQIMKAWNMENVDQYWGPDTETPARNQARAENDKILFDPSPHDPDQPKPEENHEIHIPSHEQAVEAYQTLPPAERLPRRLEEMQVHIAGHKALLSAAGEAAPGATQEAGGVPPEAEVPPRLEGEAAGDTIAAEEGAAEGGRPTIYQGEGAR